MRQSNRYPRNPERDAVAHPTGRPHPGLVDSDKGGGPEDILGPAPLCAWDQSFHVNFSGPISPVVPVIQPPRASAKD